MEYQKIDLIIGWSIIGLTVAGLLVTAYMVKEWIAIDGW